MDWCSINFIWFMFLDDDHGVILARIDMKRKKQGINGFIMNRLFLAAGGAVALCTREKFLGAS